MEYGESVPLCAIAEVEGSNKKNDMIEDILPVIVIAYGYMLFFVT
jgi:hypothetical protein